MLCLDFVSLSISRFLNTLWDIALIIISSSKKLFRNKHYRKFSKHNEFFPQSKRNPKLFWISAMAPLVSVIVGSLFVFLSHAEQHHVQVVKNSYPRSLSPSDIYNFNALNEIYKFTTASILKMPLKLDVFILSSVLLVTADRPFKKRAEPIFTFVSHFSITLSDNCYQNRNHNRDHCSCSKSKVLYNSNSTGIIKNVAFDSKQMMQKKQEGIAVGRSFAMFKNYHTNGNKEMIALGVMNIVGSFTSCYITSGILQITGIRTNAVTRKSKKFERSSKWVYVAKAKMLLQNSQVHFQNLRWTTMQAAKRPYQTL